MQVLSEALHRQLVAQVEEVHQPSRLRTLFSLS
jgi:hypothetical protein